MVTYEGDGTSNREEEVRPRSYSQENIVDNEQSMMIESRSQASQRYALSQYVCQKSVLNDETESEDEEEDETVG
jgi:hypothetical protein